MKEKKYLDNGEIESYEEYWREQDPEEEEQPYFPFEESKPPHY